jgi:hypothetical protein
LYFGQFNDSTLGQFQFHKVVFRFDVYSLLHCLEATKSRPIRRCLENRVLTEETIETVGLTSMRWAAPLKRGVNERRYEF